MTENLLDDNNDRIDVDPNKNYLEELVGEGKKFKTPEDLAKGKYISDLYIKHKEREFDSLREDYLKLRDEYNAGPKLQELLEDLVQNKQQLASNDNTDNVNGVQNKPAFDPKEIESLVSSKIQEHETSKKYEENFNSVRNKLKDVYGSNYKQVLKEKIESLGLEEDLVNDLARRHPKVLYKTLGLDQPQQDNFQTPPRSNITGFAPSNQKRTWSYYQELRKKDPKTYYNPKTQVQMHNDAISLGEEFEDGDFRVY